MRSIASLGLASVLVTVGCTGLQQFPKHSTDYQDAIGHLDPAYERVLAEAYAPGVSPGRQKQIRNEMIETRMAVIDAHFRKFEAGLAKEGASADFGVALVGVGVGAAGSLVAETASQILSAVSGGLAGAQAAYDKAVLYEKTLSALLAQMQASRKAIAAQIYEGWNLDVSAYPLWLARRHLDAYAFAGSLPGAILATAADARTKERAADQVLLREITQVSVTPEMFDRRDALHSMIDRLSAADAKSLITKIRNEFTEVTNFIDAQYPGGTQAADADGSIAKTVLRRAVVLSVRDDQDAAKWQSLIGSL